MEKELKSKRTAILLTPSVHEDMRKIAVINQVSFNEMVNQALEFFVSVNQKSIERYNDFYFFEEKGAVDNG